MLTLEEFEFLPCGFLIIFLEWCFVLFNPLIEKNSTLLLHSPQIWYFIVQMYENLKNKENTDNRSYKILTFDSQEFRVQPINSILWILWCRESGHKKIRATLFIQIWITGSHNNKFFLVIIHKLQTKTYWWKLKQ